MTHNRTCVLDVETRSAVDLRKTNAYVYAAHPTTDVWMARYAYDDTPDTVHVWWPGQPMPDDLRQHTESGGTVGAHNAAFEHAVWVNLLRPRYGWCDLALTQLDDTAARAAKCGLPRSLEKAAASLGLAQQKDTKGAQQMKRMARPRKATEVDDETPAQENPRTYTYYNGMLYEWWNVPERVALLNNYCEQDVHTQMALHKTLPLLPEAEWEVWQATLRANYRGCQIDTAFVEKAQQIVTRKLTEYAHELLVLTNGQVKSHTDLNGMKRWLHGQGIEVESLDKNAIAALLADDTLPADVHRVVGIRAEAGKSSVAKYPAMAAHVDGESIARDQLVYYGAAATGRWSGQGVQLQNLPARGGVGYVDAEWHINDTHRSGTISAQQMMETLQDGSAIETLSMCLRGAIRARPGMDIICADLSNIEGRMAAWLGGEHWKLDAFRAFDEGYGPDLYKVAAGGILGIDPADVSKPLRNSMGKVSELALQFGGGVGAFLSMAGIYGVEIADYWRVIQDALEARIIEESHEAWASFGEKSGVDKTTWLAAEAVKRAWREKHPGIVQAWRDCEDGAVSALAHPGTVHTACAGSTAFVGKSLNRKPVLLMRLPSGRCVYHFNARLRDRKTPWGTVNKQVTFDKVEGGRAIREGLYGGSIFQSATQAGARDIMAHGWLTAEKAGYLPLFSVHDELACEYPEGQADLRHYENLLCDVPPWAEGLPIAAGGYVSKRFRKD